MKRWYVVHAYSGFEKSVAQALRDRIAREAMEERFGEVLVPTEEVVEMRAGQKRRSERKFFPGYVLVQMIMTDEAWYVVRNTPGVTGFIGSSGKGAKPFPVSQEEIESVLARLGKLEKKTEVDFKVGDRVKILRGGFEDSEGEIVEMNDDKEEATVMVLFANRETPTDIPYSDIKKIEE